MSSKISSTVFAMVFVFISFACTKTIPLGPAYTGESDWAPSFRLTYNFYQRIRGFTDIVPRQSLWNNIDSCVVQVREVSSDTFRNVGNISFTNVYGFFQTSGSLEMAAQYFVRAAVYYRSGIVKVSAETSIVASVVPGKVLKTLAVPNGISFNRFWISGGQILVYGYLNSTSGWWSVDTASGKFQFLRSSPTLSAGSQFYQYNMPALSGDTAYVPSLNAPGLPFAVLRYSLSSDWIDSTLVLGTTEGQLGGIIVSGDRFYVDWSYLHFPDVRMVYDLRSGQLLETYDPGLGDYGQEYLIDTTIWVNITDYNSRNVIGRLDFSSSQADESLICPVYSPYGLAWDGERFWVGDEEKHALVRLQLESQ